MGVVRWFWSVLTAFTIALVPMAFGQDAKSTIRLHSPGPSVLSLAFEIAKEEVFYRQESVYVDLITIASGCGVQGLIGGSVDASQILGLTLRAAINRGASLKIVMVFNDRPTYRLMAKKDMDHLAILKEKLSPVALPERQPILCCSDFWKNAVSFLVKMSR